MSLSSTLEQLEEKFYDELEEDRDAVIEALKPLHTDSLAQGIDAFREFAGEVIDFCGGVYIPHILWVELARYIEDNEGRENIYKIIQAFVDSGFETPERKKMKPLLITYFAMEREFEVNKIMTLIVDKAHPDVQEFFRKVQSFVEKNKTSVDMYIEKFQMLKSFDPDFELLRMPVIKLKEHLGETAGNLE